MSPQRDDRKRSIIFKGKSLFSALDIFVAAPIFDFAQADARVPTSRALRVSICFAGWQANWSA